MSQAECAHGLRHPPRFRGPRPRHHRHRHRLRAALLRREPPPRRERPRGLRGRGHHLAPCPASSPCSSAKGLRPEAVDYVIVTHVHLDHAGGAGEMMRRLPGARLVVHPRGARHMIDPSKLRAGAAAVYGEEAIVRNYGDARPRRSFAGDRGSRGPPPRARRTAPPLPGHARARAPPLLRLGRGLALHVHRGHLRPRVPRAREPARLVHPAHHHTGAVRARSAPRVDRPAARRTCRRR